MSFEAVEKVYALGTNATSSTEQAVLLALAYRQNNKTLKCYPSQTELVRMTHLSRSAINRSLNSLCAKGLLEWDRGGRTGARGRYGKILSNSYRLKLPETGKRNGKSGIHAGISNPAVSSSQTSLCPPDGQSCVLQTDKPVSSSATLQCPPGGQTSVPHEDTNRNNIKEINNRNTNRNESGSESVFGSALNGVLRDMPDGQEPSKGKMTDMQLKNAREKSKPGLALADLAGLTRGTDKYAANVRTFNSWFNKFPSLEDCWQFVYEMESRDKNGEFQNAQNLPAVFTTLLKKKVVVP